MLRTLSTPQKYYSERSVRRDFPTRRVRELGRGEVEVLAPLGTPCPAFTLFDGSFSARGFGAGFGPAGTTLAIGRPFLVMIMARRVWWTSAISLIQFLQNSTSDIFLARIVPSGSNIGNLQRSFSLRTSGRLVAVTVLSATPLEALGKW